MKVLFLYSFSRWGLERLSNLPKSPDFTKCRTRVDGSNLLRFGASVCLSIQCRSEQVVTLQVWGEPLWKFPLAMKLVSCDPPRAWTISTSGKSVAQKTVGSWVGSQQELCFYAMTWGIQTGLGFLDTVFQCLNPGNQGQSQTAPFSPQYFPLNVIPKW